MISVFIPDLLSSAVADVIIEDDDKTVTECTESLEGESTRDKTEVSVHFLHHFDFTFLISFSNVNDWK